jgi:hypothetical protein
VKIWNFDLKIELKSIIFNFIKDIRIFLATNFIWFFLIYLLMFYKKRKDIIKNMFSFIVIMFLVMVWGIIFYIFWQDWVTNIIKNDFLWYSYIILIISFIGLFLYYNNKNISNNWKIEKWDKTTIVILSTLDFIWSIFFIPFDL